MSADTVYEYDARTHTLTRPKVTVAPGAVAVVEVGPDTRLENWRAWQQHGATPETHGTMVHVLVGVTSVTSVVDADSEVGRLVMAELKRGHHER